MIATPGATPDEPESRPARMSPQRHALVTGTAFAFAAGLMWGLVFIAPTLLAEYPPALLVVGRYLAFGLIALPLGWLARQALAGLSRADWIEALKLSAVGNLLYYLCLAAAIQMAGGPLPTMIIGTLPVVIAIVSNLRRGAPCARATGGCPGRGWRRRWRSSRPASASSTRLSWRACRPRATWTWHATAWARCWRWAPWPAGPGTPSATPTGCARTPTAPPAPGPRRRGW
jgi:hypothetical protein